MKYMNIIKLLSVLLCIGMLFCACSDAEEGKETESGTVEMTENVEEATTEGLTDEPLLENVESKFENFFELLGEESGELESAQRIDGDVVAYNEKELKDSKFFVIKNTDIDTKNNVTETFELYNLNSGEVTLTLTNSYFNGNYDTFSWNNIMVKENIVYQMVYDADGNPVSVIEVDETLKYPESVMKVEFESYSVSYSSGTVVLDLVKVYEAKVTPIDEETRLENPDGCVYEIEVSVTYYDVYGNLVTTVAPAYDRGWWGHKGNYWSVGIGNTIAYFDDESCELVGTTSHDDMGFRGGFVRENDRYGYYGINNTSTLNDSEMGIRSNGYFEIYDKMSGELVRYYLDENYRYAQLNYLHNGDILIQYTNKVEEGEPFDYYEPETVGFGFYTISHVMFDVDKGTMTEISLPYYITLIRSSDEFSDVKGFEADGIAVKDNARNIAYVKPIVNKTKAIDHEIVIFDNDMSVLYSFERIVPEHKFDPVDKLGFEMLPNGDRLVTLNNIVTDKAIVRPDGTVRAYLTASMQVAGDYVIGGNKVYDYDLNLVYDLGENGYEYVTTVFGEILFIDPNDLATSVVGGEQYIRYFTLGFTEVEGEEVVEPVEFFNFIDVGSFYEVQIISVTDEFVIIRNKADGKYTLYNESFTEILTTYNEMYIVEFDGGYLVTTQIEGDEIAYLIK